MTLFQKHVLVTGGAGFIGSNLLRLFLQKYPSYCFICMDKLNYVSQNLHNITDILKAPNFRFIQVDLADYDTLLAALANLPPVTDIINLAAESCVDKSFETPLYFTRNNILSTQNLLEYYRLYCPHNINFIHVSTDEVYGEQAENNTVSENEKLNPTNPYSATKAAIDMIIKSYEYSYNLPITIIRSNNVYGPNQYPEKIIPTAIDKLRKGEKIPIHGNGHNKRSYLYIDDFVDAIDLLWTKNVPGVFNVGSPFEIDNLSLVKLIVSLYNSSLKAEEVIDFVKDRNYNDCRYCIEYSKLTKLGWSPKVDLGTGLGKLLPKS